MKAKSLTGPLGPRVGRYSGKLVHRWVIFAEAGPSVV